MKWHGRNQNKWNQIIYFGGFNANFNGTTIKDDGCFFSFVSILTIKNDLNIFCLATKIIT